jgi:hypothetical protein
MSSSTPWRFVMARSEGSLCVERVSVNIAMAFISVSLRVRLRIEGHKYLWTLRHIPLCKRFQSPSSNLNLPNSLLNTNSQSNQIPHPSPPAPLTTLSIHPPPHSPSFKHPCITSCNTFPHMGLRGLGVCVGG